VRVNESMIKPLCLESILDLQGLIRNKIRISKVDMYNAAEGEILEIFLVVH